MGMSATQANLLTLTSRLHDVEYQTQHLESQKIALATQKDEVYDDYIASLDAKKIQVGFNNDGGKISYNNATFSSVATYQENRKKQYALLDANSGKVIVDSDTYNAYTKGQYKDKYSFAWAMLGMGLSYSYEDSKNNSEYGQGTEIGFGTSGSDSTSTEGANNLFMTEAEQYAYDKNKESSTKIVSLYENLCQIAKDTTASQSQKDEALQSFRNELYKNTAIKNDIYEYMRRDKNAPKEPIEYSNDFPENMNDSQFDYYVRLFEQIQAAGGCQEIETQYQTGDDGVEWFNNMVTSGKVLIEVYNENKKEWQDTSVTTSTNENYLQSVSDTTDQKKAERAYENELDKINDKDTQLDKEISKLETERTAIKTEIDSIKKIKDENVERTFGIFS